MAEIKVVPQELWEQMREYVFDGDVVLISQRLFDEMPDDQQKFITEIGMLDEYNFYNCPDTRLDIVADIHHLFLSDLDKAVKAYMATDKE